MAGVWKKNGACVTTNNGENRWLIALFISGLLKWSFRIGPSVTVMKQTVVAR